MILYSRILMVRRNLFHLSLAGAPRAICEARFFIIGVIKMLVFFALNDLHSLDAIVSEPTRPSGVYKLRAAISRKCIIMDWRGRPARD